MLQLDQAVRQAATLDHVEQRPWERPARSWTYRALGEPRPHSTSDLETFLTERYCLYTTDERGTLLRADIHHLPWPLQDAKLELELNTMPPVALPDEPPLCHFSSQLDVVVWPLERVEG
jgi:uncharacterized protein